jgi:hypothetical protein
VVGARGNALTSTLCTGSFLGFWIKRNDDGLAISDFLGRMIPSTEEGFLARGLAGSSQERIRIYVYGFSCSESGRKREEGADKRLYPTIVLVLRHH